MKKVISILVAMLLSIGIVACGEKKEEPSNEPTETKKEEVKKEETKKEEKDPIETLKEKLTEAGVNIGESSTVEYRKIGATSGQKFKFNEEMLEVYYYDQDKMTIEDKKLFRQVNMGNLKTPETNLSFRSVRKISFDIFYTILNNLENRLKIEDVIKTIK